MKSIFIIDSCFPINSRNYRILNSLSSCFNVNVITWNRESNNTDISDDRMHIYTKYSPGGNKLMKLKNLFGYFRYINNVIRTNPPAVIIASHWDMLLCSVLIKRKGQIVVYDNLDIPTSSNIILTKILLYIEKICMLSSDCMILASRFYKELYSDNYKKPIYVIENLPVDKNMFKFDYQPSVVNQPLKIAYIGGIRYYDILKNLCDAISDNNLFQLSFYGDGHDLPLLKDYAHKYHNIEFFGRFNHNELVDIYKKCDLVWAAYPNLDFNVKYAISNKFFDSIFSSVPTVFSIKTKLGDYVELNQIGYTVDPYSVSDIRRFLISINNDRRSLIQISNNLQAISKTQKSWSESFVLFLNYLNNEDC